MPKNVINLKIIFVAASLILVFVSIRAIYISLFMKVRTECAKFVKYDEFIDSNALIIRDEKLIKSDAKYIRMLCHDGSKIAHNQTIARIYDSNDKLLTDSQNSVYEKIRNINIHSINFDINNYIRMLVHKNERNDHINYMLKLREQIFSQRNEDLINHKNQSKSISGLFSELKSKDTGVFSSFTDGFEENLNLDMNNDEIKNLKIVDYMIPKKQENVFGKIILDNKCKILCYIDKNSNLQDTFYYIKFKLNSDEFLCNLIDIIDVDNKKIAIFLSDTNQYLINSRVESVKVKISSSQGVKINKKYIKIQNNQEGVFVLDRKIVKFKLINPIYENNKFIISDPDENNQNTIHENDLIITSGENLYDGKVLAF